MSFKLCPPSPTALPPNNTSTPAPLPWLALGRRVREWWVRGGGVEGPPEDKTCHVSRGTAIGDTEEDTEGERPGGKIEWEIEEGEIGGEGVERAESAGVRSIHHVSL